jgi:hypothetical protein
MKLVPPSHPRSSCSFVLVVYCKACFGIRFVSILCTCCSHFFWYCFTVLFISGTVLLFYLFLVLFYCFIYFWYCFTVLFISGIVLLFYLFLVLFYLFLVLFYCFVYFITVLFIFLNSVIFYFNFFY